MSGLPRDRFAETGHGLIRLALGVKDEPKVVERTEVPRLQRDGFAVAGGGFAQLSLGLLQDADVVVSDGGIRAHGQGGAEGADLLRRHRARQTQLEREPEVARMLDQRAAKETG